MRVRMKSIRFQLLAIMLVCYLAPTLLLGEYMGNVFFSDLREKTETALTSGAEHALTLARQNVERAVTLAKDATYDAELTNVYAGYIGGTMSPAEMLRLSRGYLDRKYSREEIFTFAACFPVTAPEMLIYNRSGYDQAAVYLSGAHERVIALGETLDTRCLFLQEGDEVYLVRNLYNLRMERFGMLVLGVDMEVLMQPLEQLTVLWDAEVDVMLGEAGAVNIDWDALTPGLADSGRAEEIGYTSRTADRDYVFNMHMTVFKERVYGEMEAFRRMMAGLFFLLVPIMMLIMGYVNRRIVRPIALLSEASRRIEAGELGVTVPMHGADELGDLGRAFSNMSTRIANLIDKTYKEEIALRDARIQAMQSRINPHFINNALESINWQARMEGSEGISAMVDSLSVLLNASMARGNRRMVPLSEEEEAVKAYLYFISLRFGERLTVTTHFDEEMMHAVVPLLTLQPLLENAVEHGLAPAGGGEIAVSCVAREEMLMMEVVNGGKPLTDEDRRRIDTALEGDSEGGNHLGLANIASRLRLIYGGRAGIEVTQDERMRTVVRLHIPLGKVEGRI
ncbi:MAG: sensor histidine kinase [Clostridia bacterium]|nr:sensor histidine kinase [Clostridia bacterium]